MHPCMVLLDQALEIVKQEEHALAVEDLDKLEALSAQRNDILTKAWEQRLGADNRLLKTRLRELLTMHEKIMRSTETLQESVRSMLSTRRKQGGYFAGAKSRTSHASKSFYLSKTS